MASMAIDPADVMSEGGGHLADIAEPPPLLLSEPLDPSPPLPSLRESEVVAEVHRRWAVNTSGAPSTAPDERRTFSRRIVQGARRLASVIHSNRREQQELIGALIRAVDAVAARADELAQRLHSTERHLDELLKVMSEDLVQIRAVVASAPPQQRGQRAEPEEETGPKG